MVFLCLSLSVVSTIEDHEYEDLIEDLLFQLEIVIVVWFAIEFLIRLSKYSYISCISIYLSYYLFCIVT